MFQDEVDTTEFADANRHYAYVCVCTRNRAIDAVGTDACDQ